MKAFLKWGCIGGLIGFIFGLLALVINELFGNTFLLVDNAFSLFITFMLCYENIYCAYPVYIITSIIAFFLISELICWIYQKIKKRNK